MTTLKEALTQRIASHRPPLNTLTPPERRASVLVPLIVDEGEFAALVVETAAGRQRAHGGQDQRRWCLLPPPPSALPRPSLPQIACGS